MQVVLFISNYIPKVFLFLGLKIVRYFIFPPTRWKMFQIDTWCIHGTPSMSRYLHISNESMPFHEVSVTVQSSVVNVTVDVVTDINLTDY